MLVKIIPALLALLILTVPAQAKDVLDVHGPQPVPTPEMGAGAPPPPVVMPPLEKPNPWHLGPPGGFFGIQDGVRLDKSAATIGEEELWTIYDFPAPEPWEEFDTYVVEGGQPDGDILRITGQGTLAAAGDCSETLKNIQAKVEKLHGPATEHPANRLLWSWDSATIEALCSEAGVIRLIYTHPWRLDLHREYLQRQAEEQ